MNSNDSPASSGMPLDPVEAVTHSDPYPFYASLRNGPPLAWNDKLRLWVASRAGVIEEVLQAHGALRVRPAAEPVPGAIAGSLAGEVFGHLVRMNDGAAHEAHRPALQRALAGLDLHAVREAALQVALRVPAQQPLSDALFSIPVRSVAHLLGFADEALPQIDLWTRDFVACLSPLSTAGQLQAASAAAGELMARFEGLIAATPPRQGTLLAAVLAESAAPSRSLLANLVGLLSQTCDATAGLLGNSFIAFMRDPSLRTTARTRDGLQAIVEETARHDPSVHNTRRFAASPVTIAGTPLAAGDVVLVLLASANRDPSFNPDPDSFILVRAKRRMLGFGHGMHACPGQALACTLAAAGLEALLHRAPDVDAQRLRGWHYRPSVAARVPVFH
ncbi:MULTISPECIES: cytochrome P450 [Variovorax]|jgi:cytochrome P450|uniref:cytochrome P450 n=2 Tax=Comamonadaceae TaxID=80864 RepID=UPI00086F90E3|nr:MULTISPECIES: cytochrome P450 [Variovorax]ODU15005.1 MAG: cytochrome [Variovorax sp. SCN 67-85]ODV23933.1 MAG: cytochrome [Variovorax sp. SCN 67-20]OJZ03544.1 MAG: cytochrome [Variovorax sp. 67-131]UKI07235.1 cytochrome P450 [Variovorax paradoxus]